MPVIHLGSRETCVLHLYWKVCRLYVWRQPIFPEKPTQHGRSKRRWRRLAGPMSAPRQPHWASSAAILHSSSVLETLLPSPLAGIPPHMHSLARQTSRQLGRVIDISQTRHYSIPHTLDAGQGPFLKINHFNAIRNNRDARRCIPQLHPDEVGQVVKNEFLSPPKLMVRVSVTMHSTYQVSKIKR